MKKNKNEMKEDLLEQLSKAGLEENSMFIAPQSENTLQTEILKHISGGISITNEKGCHKEGFIKLFGGEMY